MNTFSVFLTLSGWFFERAVLAKAFGTATTCVSLSSVSTDSNDGDAQAFLSSNLVWRKRQTYIRSLCLCGALAILSGPTSLLAQATAKAQAPDELKPPASSDDSTAAVAEQLQNPIANLVSVPLQSNWDTGLGPDHNGWRYTLNIQPVIPVSLTDDWMLISRTILPFIDQENGQGPFQSRSGLGDTVQSFFFSPKAPGPGGLIWGAGPALLLPTATDSALGSGKAGAGPTLVMLCQNHGWTYGVLTNHIWSYAGNGSRSDVDATFIQPFLSYTTQKAFTAGINMESTYDWNADQWTIPINLQFSQVVKVGNQLMSIGIGGRAYAERPGGGPDWGARLTVTFLFPKKPE